jgi:ABC-2 type transport system permease protein
MFDDRTMTKIFTIAWHEFRKNVFRRRFIGVLLFPLIIMLIASVVGFVTVNAISRFSQGSIGYVDPNNALARATNPPDASFKFVRFDDEPSAKAALEREEILGYVALSDDFLQSGKAEMYYWKDQPDRSDVRDALRAFRNTALLADQPADIANRVTNGTKFTYQTPDGANTRDGDSLPAFVLPLVLTIFFIASLFGGAQYLMQAVLDEKENRTMEVVVTSVTPTQLMAGKVIGLGAVGLLQMVVWLLAFAVALAVLRPRIPFLQNVSLKPDFIALSLLLFSLQYVLLGAFMAAIGSMVVDAKQGQNYSSPFTIIAIAPMWFLAVILIDPNGVFAVILSLFPLTSPLVLLMRYGMVSVPAWQIIVAVVLLALSAAAAIWLAGRIFRVGMLRFDKGVKWNELAESIRF